MPHISYNDSPMSMITRCPDCSTLFKVVADQLRVSEGWVRCGKCGLVFDGQAQLVDGAQEAPPEQDDPVTPAATQVAEPVPDTAMPQSEAFVATTESWDDAGTHATPDAAPVMPADPTPEVTFVRVAQRKARWRRPWVRWALGLLALMLCTTLALQAAVFERHRLVGLVPEVKPWMSELCRPLGCNLGPTRQLEALAVESSSFNRLRVDQYRLNVQVRNNADVDVLLPAIELTLKDARDEVLLRRVLLPADFGAQEPGIAAQAEWNAKAVVQLGDAALAARVTQFSALAFYP